MGYLNALRSTAYGEILTLKPILFVGMVGLGAINLLSTKPRFLKAARQGKEEQSTAKMALIRIGAESALALMVFLVSGVLTALPPVVCALHQAALVKNTSGSASASLTATQLQPAEGASVQIVTPAPGQIFAGDQVPLQFKLLKGTRGDHVHAYVDGELMGMFLSKKGTLTGIKPGRHLLELRVVAEGHQTELDARDRIEFWVR
ncbi:MAG: CopD family protein [Alphaproteobacteria bacterium]